MTTTEDSKLRAKRGAAVARDLFMYDWDSLRALLDVARKGSINAAAEELEVQHTTLSRRIAALEKAVGRPLVHRSARGVQLTADGMELVSVLERFDEDLTAVGRWITRGVKGAERPISVNMACTEGLSAYWLTEFLTRLRKRNVRACYNIHTSLSARPEKNKVFHAAVQMYQPANTEMSEQIGTVHFSAMASRAYLDEMGTYKAGQHPGHHRWIEYAPFRVMSGSWEAWFQRQKVEVAPFAVTNSLVTTVNAVRAGVGIGLLPTYMSVTTPDLAPIDTGLRLKFPIWLTIDAKSLDTPELSAALGLIRAAIDPKLMPWFREKLEFEPEPGSWRAILDVALNHLA